MLRLACAAMALFALIPATPPDPGGPYSVSGDPVGKVDIRVRDDDPAGVQGDVPRRPTAQDAPEGLDQPCLAPKRSPQWFVPECLAAGGGGGDDVVRAALEARGQLVLPRPAPVLRPQAQGLIGAPIWLWSSPAHWSPDGQPLAREVRAGAVWAKVGAAAVRLSWLPGDGATVTCRTPGTPLDNPADAANGSPDCGYTYRAAGRYQVTVSVTWAVTWLGSDGSSGALAPLTVVTTFPYQVRAGRSELVSP